MIFKRLTTDTLPLLEKTEGKSDNEQSGGTCNLWHKTENGGRKKLKIHTQHRKLNRWATPKKDK
jgi:hypothetical protein